MWLELAYRLKKSLQEVQTTTTSTEFILWSMWLNERNNKKLKERDKQEFYMAQLTAEVRRSWVAKPNSVKSDLFLIEFGLKDADKVKDKPMESVDSRMQKSKSFWSAVLVPKKGK